AAGAAETPVSAGPGERAVGTGAPVAGVAGVADAAGPPPAPLAGDRLVRQKAHPAGVREDRLRRGIDPAARPATAPAPVPAPALPPAPGAAPPPPVPAGPGPAAPPPAVAVAAAAAAAADPAKGLVVHEAVRLASQGAVPAVEQATALAQHGHAARAAEAPAGD